MLNKQDYNIIIQIYVEKHHIRAQPSSNSAIYDQNNWLLIFKKDIKLVSFYIYEGIFNKRQQNIMFNQLTASDKHYNKSKKNSIYQQFLKRSQEAALNQSKELQRNQSRLKQKQQRLYQRLVSKSFEDDERLDLSQFIKARLRSKQVELPYDLSSSMRQPTLNIHPEPIRISSNQSYLSNSHQNQNQAKARKRRVRTHQNDHIIESQSQQNHPYEQTIKEIDQLNRLFFRNTNKKAIKDNDYSIRQFSPSPSPPRRLNHLSRHHDFERYINHLQKLHSYKSQIKYNYNPIQYIDSPIKSRFPEIASPRIATETKHPIRLTPSPSTDNKKNDNFISILQKVKARGESLLVKLKKFPTYRLAKN